MNSREAYALLAASYDSAPNALIALEQRVVDTMLPRAKSAIDIAGGTGRWAKRLACSAVVVDDCEAMLARSEMPSVCADAALLPFRDASVDLAICAFAIGYCLSAFEEGARLLRVGGHLIVTDVHPERIQDGWRRTFRVADRVIEPPSTIYKLADLCDSRLVLERMVEAPLGAQERAMLVAAGKEVPDGPAIFAGCWRKLPG